MTIPQVRRALVFQEGLETMLRKIALAVLAIAVTLVIVGVKWWGDHRAEFTVELPNYPPVGKVIWLQQNWTPQESAWFYHADQGTQTFGIPYEWFMALEEPIISLSSPGLLSDPVYLDRYGFIPDTQSAKPELPIGFAHNGVAEEPSGAPFLNPQTNKPMTSLGLTCAACHTGRLSYQGQTIVVDGGPALTNIKNFQKAVGLSIVFTHLIPGRFCGSHSRPGRRRRCQSHATKTVRCRLRPSHHRRQARIRRQRSHRRRRLHSPGRSHPHRQHRFCPGHRRSHHR